jgi:hypothetical protein
MSKFRRKIKCLQMYGTLCQVEKYNRLCNFGIAITNITHEISNTQYIKKNHTNQNKKPINSFQKIPLKETTLD